MEPFVSPGSGRTQVDTHIDDVTHEVKIDIPIRLGGDTRLRNAIRIECGNLENGSVGRNGEKKISYSCAHEPSALVLEVVAGFVVVPKNTQYGF